MAMMTHTVKIENRDNSIYEVDEKRPLLESLREQGVDLPYGCKSVSYTHLTLPTKA